MTRFLVQSRVSLGGQHEIWSKQHNGKVSYFQSLFARLPGVIGYG
jgi:hypothetical protein